MGEVSKYFVPLDEGSLLGRQHQIAERFWDIGWFLTTPDGFIEQRIVQWQQEGRALPEAVHEVGFAEMGLGGDPLQEPVPGDIAGLCCPHCEQDVTDEAHAVWADETSDVARSQRGIRCPHCAETSLASGLDCADDFTFSRFFLWISDVDEEEWDDGILKTVESILGPCSEITAWGT